MSGRSDEQLATLVCRDDDAFRIYQMGYSRGHQDGQKYMVLTNDQVIERAARRERVLSFLDEETRRERKSTREFIDVKAARERDAR